jgi:hypothetical protein
LTGGASGADDRAAMTAIRRCSKLAIALHACSMIALVAGTARAAGPKPREVPAPSLGSAPARFDLQVIGPAATPDKVRECRAVFVRWGARLEENAPIKVVLELRERANHLSVQARGADPVIDDMRPGWRLSTLCTDALAWAADASAMSPPPAAAPPPAPRGRARAEAGPPRMALEVVGHESNADKTERCRRIFADGGVTLDPGAPIRVVLKLEDNANQLVIHAAGRGKVVDKPMPGATMARLCGDALTHGLAQLRLEAIPPPAALKAEVAPAPPQRDSSKDEARGHHESATRAYAEARYDEAIKEWNAAFDLDPHPQFLFNLGNCYLKRGGDASTPADLRHARQYFVRYKTLTHGTEADESLRAIEAQLHKHGGRR